MGKSFSWKIEGTNFKPKEAWDNLKILNKVHAGYDTKKATMKLHDLDRNLATSDRENSEMTGDYFSNVFNRISNVDWDYLSNIS